MILYSFETIKHFVGLHVAPIQSSLAPVGKAEVLAFLTLLYFFNLRLLLGRGLESWEIIFINGVLFNFLSPRQSREIVFTDNWPLNHRHGLGPLFFQRRLFSNLNRFLEL
jgi:hypothetical protein